MVYEVYMYIAPFASGVIKSSVCSPYFAEIFDGWRGGLTTGQLSFEETRRAVGNFAFDFTGPYIEPKIFRTGSDVFSHYANCPVQLPTTDVK